MATGDFCNKVAIITGASSGFGEAIAILFAKKGASLVLCGRDEERLKAALAQCTEASGGHRERFIFISGDITEAATRQKIVDKTIEEFQRLDILVANAGIMLPEDNIADATEASFDAIVNTNVKAIFFLIQAAVPHLEKSGGNVVNISSVLSTLAISQLPIYALSKAALDHMTRCLALALGPKGIRLNTVNPSYVPTRMRRSFGDNFEEIAAKTAEAQDPKHPLHGKCITVDDLANTVAFVASDAARSITGQCHIVDGGRNFKGN